MVKYTQVWVYRKQVCSITIKIFLACFHHPFLLRALSFFPKMCLLDWKIPLDKIINNLKVDKAHVRDHL